MELMNIETFQIARRFAQAGQSYDEHAVIQKKIAMNLMQLISQYLDVDHVDRVFEIGCGSGNLTKFFMEKIQTEKLSLNDLYLDVQQHFEEQDRFEWCIGDAESIAFPIHQNLIMSSSALQWMHDLDGIFHKTAAALDLDGLFCFSTFGQNNLREIKALTKQGLDYYSCIEIQTKLEQHGFEVIHIAEHIELLNFKHPKHILQHLKATGVTATASKFRWTKASLDAFFQGYRQFIATDEQENLVYPLSYHPIYVITRRVR